MQEDNEILNAGSVQEVAPEVEQEVQEQEGSENEEAAPSKAVEQEIKRINKLKLKIDGAELEEELPFEIEEDPEIMDYLTKNLQKAKAADKRFAEANQTKQMVTQLVNTLQKDTKKALQELGIDPRKFAAQILEEELKAQQMTPEERERQELQMKLKELEEEHKRKKEEYSRKELERLQQLEYERIDTQITQAIQNSSLPKSPYVVEKIARYMQIGLDAGLQVEPADVIDIVRSDIEDDIKQMFSAMPEDVIEQFVGKDKFNKIRKKNLEI